MPPKSKKQKEVVQDERFQAIVLTDSFETRFMPLTSVKPRCLLPLANVPLLEYTLEFLARANVNEVYLMCSSHADQIQHYIEKSRWNGPQSPFHITTIMALESRSVGDAMRDLDSRGLISGDFLLVSGDVVTNIDFEKALQFHKQKKATDKDHICTMVLTPGSPTHRTRSPVDPATFLLDKKTSKCLFYQGIPTIESKKKSDISIDTELLEDVTDMALRNDLIDCHIDICTPHVPQIYLENFDYQHPRNDFLKGILASDLLRKTIYAYIIGGDEYAARVESWATYAAISQDILARWCYPLVPDSNLLDTNTYSYEIGHVYKEDKIVLAQSCKIGKCTAIGTGTSIGEGSNISDSVIGRNCLIGANVTIQNSYVWDNAIIEDDAQISHAIIASHATVKKDASLSPGVVVGFNVVIGAGKHIPRHTRLVERPIIRNEQFGTEDFSENENSDHSDEDYNQVEEEEEEDDDEKTMKIPYVSVQEIDVVGDEGVGYVYQSEDDDEDDYDSDDTTAPNYHGIVYQLKTLNISDDSISSLSSRHRGKHSRSHSRSRRFSTNSAVSDTYGDADDVEEHFDLEAFDTVKRSVDNNHELESAMLELNTLRMSHNASYHDVRMATTKALLYKIAALIDTNISSAKETATRIFSTWGPMYTRQVFNDEEQVDLCLILQLRISEMDRAYSRVILFVAISKLYELDVLEEENIIRWWESPSSKNSADLEFVREATGQFIAWLQTAEEESDDE
ncbi:uncharacterized protein KQ657_000210 [Scheffersomyces spartinae]|uniref:Translation initiation factor eIF2B subunit epsilon n=1 Tax=Scheffersomyces spartinae TaxID=45513 RepID=A0A9P7VDK2_9ASCO|nr:uncharacterized protein KQ657_000210 [Scheffersomyces spartinae]KAG7196198.1 hypothetical protein KQ657_000210 [Scheffersomyces spartinae]